MFSIFLMFGCNYIVRVRIFLNCFKGIVFNIVFLFRVYNFFILYNDIMIDIIILIYLCLDCLCNEII